MDTGRKYSHSFAKHGENPKSLKWLNYQSATQRYVQLVHDLDFENKTILDAGCGMGDLLPFLYSKSSNFDYLGMDIAPEFINIAKKRYDGHNFQVGDPFSDDFKQNFDIVLSCGVMNHNSPHWLEKRKKMIAKLFGLTTEVLAFNMAGGIYDSKEVKNIAYANLQDIFTFCSSLTPQIIVRAHYHSNDFTIVLFKPRP